jgi:hypothetical protein
MLTASAARKFQVRHPNRSNAALLSIAERKLQVRHSNVNCGKTADKCGTVKFLMQKYKFSNAK